MMRKILVHLLVLLLLCPARSVLAATPDSADILQFFYLTYSPLGQADWHTEEITFHGSFTAEQEAYLLMDDFFTSGLAVSVPQGVSVIGVKIEEDTLTVNVSRQILQYGGTANENILLAQFLKTALDMPGIHKVTLLVDSFLRPLPEGSLIREATTWSDYAQEAENLSGPSD